MSNKKSAVTDVGVFLGETGDTGQSGSAKTSFRSATSAKNRQNASTISGCLIGELVLFTVVVACALSDLGLISPPVASAIRASRRVLKSGRGNSLRKEYGRL